MQGNFSNVGCAPNSTARTAGKFQTLRIRPGCLVVALTVTACSVAHALPSEDPIKGIWRCIVGRKATVMTWSESVATDACDGEVCRLSMEPPLMQGILVEDDGANLGLAHLRPRGSRAWAFRDMRGGIWRLQHASKTLSGTLSESGKRFAVSCRK